MGLENLLGNVTNGFIGEETAAHKKHRKDIATAKEVAGIEARAQADAEANAQIRVMEAQQKAIRNAQIQAEKKLAAAELKASLEDIRDIEFSDDKTEFLKEITAFLADMEVDIRLKHGYKKYKVYKQRIEKELKVLQRSNDANYEPIKADCDAVLARCKRFYKKWAIIASIISGIILVSSIVLAFLLLKNNSPLVKISFFSKLITGFVPGIVLGSIIGLFTFLKGSKIR